MEEDFGNNSNYIYKDNLILVAPSCIACTNENSLTSYNMRFLDYIGYEESVKESICEDNDHNDYDLLAKLEETYMQLEYRGFQIVDLFSKKELKILSQINVSDHYFDTIYTVEDQENEYQERPLVSKHSRDIFFQKPIEPTLCELLCKIDIPDNQIKEISSIVSNILHSVSEVLGTVSISARISNRDNGIGWHFDDFNTGNLYEGTLFTFTISGPGTIIYDPRYEDFPTLQNHIENIDRVGYNDSLPLLDKTRIVETRIGQGVFLPYGADVGALHSAPSNYDGGRIVFLVRAYDMHYHPNFNECPAIDVFQSLTTK